MLDGRVTQAVGDYHPFRVVLGWVYRGLTSGFVLLRNFSVARCYLWLFTLYINLKIGKNSC